MPKRRGASHGRSTCKNNEEQITDLVTRAPTMLVTSSVIRYRTANTETSVTVEYAGLQTKAALNISEDLFTGSLHGGRVEGLDN